MSGVTWSLFRSRGFSLLWFGGLISMTGDWALRVALPITVYQMTGSPAATSAVVAANVAVSLLVGAFAGVFVDRWDRKRVLVISNMLLAVVLLPLLLVDDRSDLPLLFAVVALQTALSQFVGPAEHALLPRLVPDADLAAANSLNALNNNLARLIGPVLGGLVAAGAGLSGVVIVDSVTFAVAAALIALISGSHRAAAEAGSGSALVRLGREFADGMRAAGRSPMLRTVLIVVGVVSVGEGVMGSVFAVFVDVELHGGAAELGWLASAQAIGGIAGGLMGVQVARLVPVTRQVAVSLVLFGLIDLLIFNYPRVFDALGYTVTGFPLVVPGIVGMIIVGVPGALMIAGFMTILQTEVSDEYRGRIFSTAMVIQSCAMLLGTGIAATATHRLGVTNMLTAQSGAYTLGGVCFAVLTWRVARRSGASPERLVVEPGPAPVAPAGPSVEEPAGTMHR